MKDQRDLMAGHGRYLMSWVGQAGVSQEDDGSEDDLIKTALKEPRLSPEESKWQAELPLGGQMVWKTVPPCPWPGALLGPLEDVRRRPWPYPSPSQPGPPPG